MLNKSLTVVLPVYNREASLGRSVTEMLELASELTRRFEILIVDDGSTDATFEVAEELASRFPQIRLRRHRHRRGLGATLEAAGRRVSSDVVIVHDGVTPINPEEVRQLWRERVAFSSPGTAGDITARRTQLADLAGLSASHAAMRQAHARVLGFQLLTEAIENTAWNDAESAAFATQARPAAAHAQGRSIGKIPALPRPKFLAVVADFARGE